MSQVQQGQGGGGRDQESDIKPPGDVVGEYSTEDDELPVVEVKLKITKDRGDDGSVLWWHVHPHQHHHGSEVHPHDLREEKDQNIGTFG